MIGMLVAVYVYAVPTPEVQVVKWGISSSAECIDLANAMNSMPMITADERGRPLVAMKYDCVILDGSDLKRAELEMSMQ